MTHPYPIQLNSITSVDADDEHQENVNERGSSAHEYANVNARLLNLDRSHECAGDVRHVREGGYVLTFHAYVHARASQLGAATHRRT